MEFPGCPKATPFRPTKSGVKDKEFENFVDLMKDVDMNISLSELFSNVPKYAKILNVLNIEYRAELSHELGSILIEKLRRGLNKNREICSIEKLRLRSHGLRILSSHMLNMTLKNQKL